MSTILPFPSSPHWAPTIATTDIRSLFSGGALEQRGSRGSERPSVARQRLSRKVFHSHESGVGEGHLDHVRVTPRFRVAERVALGRGDARQLPGAELPQVLVPGALE